MDQAIAQDLMQPNISRALRTRAQLRWIYFLSLGLFWFLKRPAFARFYVTNLGIRIDGPGGLTEVPFHKVHRVSLFHIPYTGGWLTLELQDGSKYRFTSMIERPDYILDTLAMAQPTLVSAEKLEQYRRSVIVADHMMARMERAFADWRTIIALQVFLPLSVAVGIVRALKASDLTSVSAVFASSGILNGLVTLSIWGIREFAEIMKKNSELIENPLNPLRDLKREKTARIWGLVAHIVAFSSLAVWMWL